MSHHRHMYAIFVDYPLAGNGLHLMILLGWINQYVYVMQQIWF